MVASDVLDELVRLLDRSEDGRSAKTSVRLPAHLQRAAALAVEHLGLAVSTTELTSAALHQLLDAAVMRAALEAHYAAHEDEIRAAAEVVAERHSDADADDVLLWVEAQRALDHAGDTEVGPSGKAHRGRQKSISSVANHDLGPGRRAWSRSIGRCGPSRSSYSGGSEHSS